MVAIQKIKRVQNVGVFHDFSWPVGLDDFQNCNLIYGLNGSGKTTLSNFLRCLELKRCDEGQFTLATEGGDIYSPGLATHLALPQVKVFNRDFVADSVFTATGTAHPIFFLGADSATKRKQIEELEKERVQHGAELTQARRKESQRITELDDIRKDIAVSIKTLLRSAGSSNPYNNYDKGSFKAKCDAHKKTKTKPYALSDEEHERHKSTAAGTAKPIIAELSYMSPDLASLKKTVDGILSRSVVSQVIEALRSNPEVNAWVGRGLKLHKDMKVKICQFCEGPLSDNRVAALDKHFSDEYTAVITAISQAKATVKSYHASLNSLALPDEARLYDDFAKAYREAAECVADTKNGMIDYLKRCDDALQRKDANPFDILEFQGAVPESMSLAAVNEQLRAHNTRTANYEGEISKARAALEEGIVANKFDRVLELEKQISDATTQAGELVTKIGEIQKQVQKLDGEIKEHRRPAEQINADLANYLGRKDITLGVEDSGYRIMRNGKPALRLSEGERTALALIYFLKTLEDRSFDRSKGVVVIDDPVSSLDANALFYAFSFIQERTKDAGQLFISTHNFGFLKLVRKWFFRINRKGEIKKTGRQARMYMLICLAEAGGRRANLQPLDRLLQEYESEYHYLFSQVVKGAEESSGTIEKFYHYPNIARRVLEAFLAFRMPESGSKSDMHEYLHKLGFDASRTNRILNFLNAHSHNKHPDGSDEHDESVLLETPAVLADVLALIGHADPGHLSEMTALIVGGSEIS